MTINNVLKAQIIELLKNGCKVVEIADKLKLSHQLVSYYKNAYFKLDKKGENSVRDTPLFSEEEQDKSTRDRQRTLDLARIDRKLFRSDARTINSLEDTFEAMYSRLGQTKVKRKPYIEKVRQNDPVGILQLSDLHFNEVVNLKHNKFNTEIAKERLDQYFYNATKYLIRNGVKHIIITFLGDIINSDRRFDERLTNAATNAEALVEAYNYFCDTIENLYREFHITDIYSVVGNESRLDKDLSMIDKLLVNNFDFIFHMMLKRYFKGVINVHDMDYENSIERVIDINGYNLLLTHGFTTKMNQKPYEVLKNAKTRHPEINGVVLGHYHSPLISIDFSRNGGLPGANSYSLNTLGIPYESPSQNVLIIENGKLNSKLIELN